MKKINAFEKADRTKSFKEQGLNGNIYWAYQYSQEAGSELHYSQASGHKFS